MVTLTALTKFWIGKSMKIVRNNLEGTLKALNQVLQEKDFVNSLYFETHNRPGKNW